ncbi:MAG: alkane 1-monooxygenase [Ruegeria sp.]|uniref:alkane 1-monooxygenase n=1 Tax=Ruegeria sp. TaxID=1879320 RepID=UPI00349E9363
MLWYAIASFLPAGLILMACLLGGVWIWLSLLAMTAHVWVMDRLWDGLLPVQDGSAWARGLSVVLGLGHFVVLGLSVAVLGQGELTVAQGLGLGLAAGLFLGQVSNSNAHELIHRAARWERALGVAVYVSLLFGHHASAHRRVHHVHVATEQDPNSARLGESYWYFLLRAWVGSFVAGFRAETALRRGVGPGHPYVIYVGGAVTALWAAWVLAGSGGALALLALAGYAQAQLLLADYVQHYGLRRRVDAQGRAEPAGPQHAWNAPHWYSGAMMLNAPRHSDHHMNPSRIYPALRLEDGMPVWPRSMPVMALLALIPPLWRRVMDPRVAIVSGRAGSDLPQSGHAEAIRDSAVAVGSGGVGPGPDVG